MYQYPTCDMHFVHRKRWVDFWDVFRNFLFIFKRWNVLQMFFFNLVVRKVCLFTNKEEFLTLLHLRFFWQFQNLSEETWSRAAENLIELCFVTFLNNKSTKSVILVWIIFPSSEIIANRVCIVLYGLSDNKLSNLNELKCDVKFCEIKAKDFQATFLILLA